MPMVVAGAGIAGAALGSVGFSITALSGMSLAAFNIGVGLVLSGVQREVLERQMRRAANQTQTRTITSRQPIAPREIVYGTVRKGGTIIFFESVEDDTQLNMVVALAGHEVENIGAVYANGEECFASGSSSASGRFSGKIDIQRHLGGAGQALVPTGNIGDWSANHKMTGVAGAFLRLYSDFEVFTSGVPNFSFDVQGRKVSDPRTSTTVFSDNPALCLSDYLRDNLYGLGLPYGEGGIDTNSIIEAANICDESVNLQVGGTEKRYTLNGVVDTSASPKDNIEAMLSAMAGRLIYRNGRWYMQAGAYRTPTVTLDEDDIRESGLIVETKRPLGTLFNGVRGSFIGEDTDWQPDEYPAYQSATFVSEDEGFEKWDTLDLPFTNSPTMATRIAKIHLLKHRRQMTAQLSGRLSAWRAQAGDTVSLNYDFWGWLDKPFEVSEVSLAIRDGALTPDLTLQETASGVYDWDSTEESARRPNPATNLPTPWFVSDPGPALLSESLYTTRDGAGVRVLLLAEWTASTRGFVSEYRVRGRRRLDENGVATGDAWITFGRTDQLYWEVRDVKPGTWDIGITAYTRLGVSSDEVVESYEVTGLLAKPQDITGLTIQQAGGLAVLKWDLHPDLDVRIGGRIVIRHSNSSTPSWANSVSIDEVNGNQTVAIVPLKPGTYLMRAIDSGGQKSLGVATIGTKGAQVIDLLNASSLQAHSTFSGTKVNCEVNGSSQLTMSYVGEMIENPNDLTNAEFIATNMDTTLTGGGTLPSGGAGTVLTPTQTLGAHAVRAVKGVVEGYKYRFSFVAKANGYNFVCLNVFDAEFGSGNELVVDLSSGLVTTSGFTPPDEYLVTDLGSGWYKIEALQGPAILSSTGGDFEIRVLENDTSGFADWQGDGTSGVIIGDVSVEAESGGAVALYEFATTMNLGSVKNVRLRSDIKVDAVNLASLIDDRAGLIDTWEDFDDTLGADTDVIVQVRVTDDDPSGTPVWGEWTRLDNTEDEFRGAQFRALLISPSPDYNLVIDELSVTADEV